MIFLEWEKNLIQLLWDEGDTWMGITYHIHKRLMQNQRGIT